MSLELDQIEGGKPSIRQTPFYDRNVIKVIALACVLIVFSMLLVGFLSYFFTEKEVIKKLKSKELGYIAESAASQVEGRIARAQETSLLLADDPAVLEWVRGGEQDEKLTHLVMEKLGMNSQKLDYSNSFIVNSITGHYWSENGTILETMSRDKPDDAWFYDTINSRKKTDVVVDYNDARKQSFVFVNVLIGDADHPLGVAGVGLSLKELSDNFQSYKYSAGSHMWMVDGAGTVHLSDRYELTGKQLSELVSAETYANIMQRFQQDVQVMETHSLSGELVDLISYPIPSMNMRLIFEIPRADTVYFLSSIKINTTIAILIALFSTVFFFFYVSRKLANPFKRALELNQQLELQVQERTREVAQRSREILDSIEYAKRIQESVLPDRAAMNRLLPQHFVIWGPRDGVGGDFYWLKETKHGCYIAVGDCTGHGVPGAFMTMLSISHLNQIVEQCEEGDPASVLSALNRSLKATLKQQLHDEFTDDGLDLALCYVSGDAMVFAGGGSSIYVVDHSAGMMVYKGNKSSIGYRRTPADYAYTNVTIAISEQMTIYLASDGISDQSGGEKGHSFGKSRLKQFMESHAGLPMPEQQQRFQSLLSEYQGQEKQRDDWTLLAFRPLARTQIDV